MLRKIERRACPYTRIFTVRNLWIKILCENVFFLFIKKFYDIFWVRIQPTKKIR